MEHITFYEYEHGKVFMYPDEKVNWIVGVDVYNHSLSIHKEYIKIFEGVKERIKSMGIKEVYSLCDSEKEARFNEAFGFKFTGNYAECSDGSISKLMKLEV